MGIIKIIKRKNLILLCPNCHSLTETYKGANLNHGRKQKKSIVNKVVVVTGSSRGIGAQIVKKTLANENYKVVLNYNNSKRASRKNTTRIIRTRKKKLK